MHYYISAYLFTGTTLQLGETSTVLPRVEVVEPITLQHPLYSQVLLRDSTYFRAENKLYMESSLVVFFVEKASDGHGGGKWFRRIRDK